MSKKAMYDLRDMLCKELDEIARKGELGAGDLDIAHKLVSTIKNIDKIEMMEDDGYSERYSRNGDWQSDMRGAYDRDMSNARRGTHYVRGHYSRDGGIDNMKRWTTPTMKASAELFSAAWTRLRAKGGAPLWSMITRSSAG